MPAAARRAYGRAMDNDHASVAIVTGASRGLGRALARTLAAAGYSLVVDARATGAIEAAAGELRERTWVEVVPGDITDPAHRRELVDAALRLGGIDLLVNNAGTLGAHPLPPLAEYPLADLRDALETNVVAPLALIQLALPSLREHGGAICNITSDAALEPYEGWSGYGAGKAALDQASHILSAEETGVRVWWVDPGDMRTRMHADAFPDEDISDRPLPEEIAPAFARLFAERPASGRYRASDLLPHAPAGV
jgi:NAD(P)-dependent dehydrogenase (short-subunit alcohol dehydrogenase family)